HLQPGGWQGELRVISASSNSVNGATPACLMRHVSAPQCRFTQVSNDIIRHPNLSSDAVRLLVWSLSLADTGDVCLSDIARHAGIKNGAFQRAKAQLKKAGYAHEWRWPVQHGTLILASVSHADRRLRLTGREVKELAPLAADWLLRGVAAPELRVDVVGERVAGPGKVVHPVVQAPQPRPHRGRRFGAAGAVPGPHRSRRVARTRCPRRTGPRRWPSG
ncbi:hypothetical protein ACSNOK_01850, partial [Streptomyces sp. URMC 126]